MQSCDDALQRLSQALMQLGVASLVTNTSRLLTQQPVRCAAALLAWYLQQQQQQQALSPAVGLPDSIGANSTNCLTWLAEGVVHMSEAD
jgi:hypothetical protein